MPGARTLRSAGRTKRGAKEKTAAPKTKQVQTTKSAVVGTKSLFAAKAGTFADDIYSEDLNVYEEYTHSVRWMIPQKVDQLTFVGRDVFAVSQDCYISFFNLRSHVERIYVANSPEKGDGVDCIAGHKAPNMFIFCEKVENARIFVVNYPSFEIAAELKDTEVNRYKGLCMLELDLIAGFSGFPNYIITIWSWRVHQRLACIPTEVLRRDQIYMASRTSVLVAECWGEGLIVWEVAQCFKKSFIMKRMKPEKVGWEVAEPLFVGICWANDGQLYAIDGKSTLYAMTTDGISMTPEEEWSQEIHGNMKPAICSFLNGVLIYGQDGVVRALKKTDKKWSVVWSQWFEDEVVRLVSNSFSDVVIAWTRRGMVYRMYSSNDEDIDVTIVCYKQRNIKRVQMIAPRFQHMAALDFDGVLCIYDMCSSNLALMKYIKGNDILLTASPTDPLLVLAGEVGPNYGMVLLNFDSTEHTLTAVRSVCLTHQIVSLVTFSDTGRELTVAAMSAGHVFVYKVSNAPDYELTLQRYTEIGRGLADCCMMSIGGNMKCFILVLFSDKYCIGERIICFDVESGKDNKVAGRMMGPYSKLLPLAGKDTIMAIPHLSRQYHTLLLSQKGLTISVKMGPIVNTGHGIKYYEAFFNKSALLTFAFDGSVILRPPEGTPDFLLSLNLVHRYENGFRQALIDMKQDTIVTLSQRQCLVVHYIHEVVRLKDPPKLRRIEKEKLEKLDNEITIISAIDKTYLDLQEEKKVKEEAMDYSYQREEIVKNFLEMQKKLIELLEENIAERPLHQLSLSEFNLHIENKKERLRQAEREREKIRLETEARIRAQDMVTAWIKKTCWDTVTTPRVKLLAIFSHYQVENYAVLPTQRDKWPELIQVEALRLKEMENDADLFKPWLEVIEVGEPSTIAVKAYSEIGQVKSATSTVVNKAMSTMSMMSNIEDIEGAAEQKSEPYALSGTFTHKYVKVPDFMIPQTLAYSFLQMNWLYEIVKLNVQNMRLWFNKQFDELMNQKKREVGMVEERNARLRFIIEELNKLSDLRLSFHHLMNIIYDPEWKQDEQPIRLTKVLPEECSIEPYISPSQIVVIPPDPGPKDDFKERALNEMMDGVLEKLWHEEIKKPIPKPACMLEKEPEQWNEEDLRHVFDYESKVAFRETERDKYRKMLHAEYAKLSEVLNEGVVKFNFKVKDLWLTKLATDSVIGQENLNLMRLRRVNLDRIEMAEKIEEMRVSLAENSAQLEVILAELHQIQEQGVECQTAYDALGVKDRQLEKSFRAHFGDLPPVILDQCTKYFKKRPKWHQRATMTPAVLYELAASVAVNVKSPMMHPDVQEYFRNVDQLDSISNMPAVMDEGLWVSMCKLRRTKIENEIRMRALILEITYVEGATVAWNKSVYAFKAVIAQTNDNMVAHRETVEGEARNKTIQLVLPAGQVEIVPTGHFEDFDDACLIRKEEIDAINDLILRVGRIKLRLMRRQIAFRKVILMKEWEHAQLKMKLRHMEQELYSYQRLKIPKELQRFLKDRELGSTDERDFVLLEKEMEATKMDINLQLTEAMHQVEDMQIKIAKHNESTLNIEALIQSLIVKCSEKRLNEDPLKPIRIRMIYKQRMDIIVLRSRLIREVQNNHSTLVLLQTELELLRLKTYPTLASFRTID